MNAICYFCNKRSTDWCRNFAEIRSQHTQTPIADFIRQFLADFHSTRDIDDKYNYICTECLEQIDDYDWLKQQATKQESKLCSILLATEVILSEKYDDENDGGRHKHARMDVLNTTEIKLEPKNEAECTDACEEQPPPESQVVSPKCRDKSKLVADLQSKCKYSCVRTTKSKDAASQKNNIILMSTSTEANSKVITSSMDTTALSSQHRDAPANDTKTPEKGLQPMPISSQTIISSSVLNNVPKWIPATQTSRKRTFLTIPKSIVEQNHFYVQQNGKPCKVTLVDLRKKSKISTENGSTKSKASDLVFLSAKDVRVPSSSSPLPSTANGAIESSSLLDSHSTPTAKSTVASEYRRPPPISTNCLIAMAFINSHTGYLLTSEIYNFISDHFPYFRETGSHNWKRSVRWNLSSSKCYEKVERKNIVVGIFDPDCLWQMNPSEIIEMNAKLQMTISSENAASIRKAMAVPENWPALLRGDMKHGDLNHMEPKSNKTAELSSTYVKPALTYTRLVAMALKNSRTGSLLVSEILSFVCKHFPYFRSATENWMSGIRYNLKSNPCFEKVEPNAIKSLWSIKPSKVGEINKILKLQSHRHPTLIESAMAVPGDLPALMRGEMKHGSWNNSSNVLNNNDNFEPDYKQTGKFIGGKENVQVSESNSDASDESSEVDIDDTELFQ